VENEKDRIKNEIERLKEKLLEIGKEKNQSYRDEVSRGDNSGLSSAYLSTLEKQRFLLNQIRDREKFLTRLDHIVKNGQNDNTIGIGSVVLLSINYGDGHEEFISKVVLSFTPDPEFISINSVMGKTIIGKKAGDNFEFESPMGKITGNILAVNPEKEKTNEEQLNTKKISK